MIDALATWLLAGGGVAIGGGAGALVARAWRAAAPAEDSAPSAAHVAARLRAAARAEAEALVREAEIAAREAALVTRAEADAGLRAEEERLGRLATALVEREVELGARDREAEANRERLRAREAPLDAGEDERDAQRDAAAQALAEVRARLERIAGARVEELRRALREAEIEAARATGSQLVRQVAESAADPDHTRSAKRIMAVAVGRFEGHYLTERHHALIPLGELKGGPPPAPVLEAVAAVAGVRLTLTEEGDAIRLEGLDGVGREVARRSMARLLKRGAGDTELATRFAKESAAEVDREVVELGRRAFAVLQIQRAHPEIVKLVGRLNWRTSFTQNQWKHAVEVAFLCGMMAEEMGLDPRLARRAALMHDIGKALTHAMDGSHAVIGADHARRLGESELVANAIGAHHTDEPFNSPYAYLVAAADAMSGARPGARRQTEDNYVGKIADLERISRTFSGVAEAFAVQGGREVRVLVREGEVDDLGAVQLSSKIAEAISSGMTFPGQIRVTVIREFKAVESAGG
jgi:ribonuclease Y